MTESAARLVDDVLPRVPVRQWVLSLPYRLRYLLAWDHALARTLFRLFPHNVFFPGVFLAVTVLAVNMLGDGLRDMLDPRTRKQL